MDERKEKRIGGWKGILLIALCTVLLLSTGVGTAKYAQQIEVEENLTLDIFAQVIVTLNYMDGKSASEEFSYEGTLPTPERAGYTFDGWYIGVEGADAWTYGDKLTGDPENGETLLAKWSINEYSISYDLGGGNLEENIENPEIYTVENEDIVLNNPTKIGYAFLGWTGSNGETAQMTVNIPKGSTGDKTYIANWEAVPTAYLYSDGSFVFTNGGESSLDTAKTLIKSYTGWDETQYSAGTQPWANEMATIESVEIVDGVSLDETDYWFYGASNLTKVYIGSGVSSIGNYAFYECSNLTGNLTIPGTVTEIGEYAFNKCTGLSGTLTVSPGVQTIGANAFDEGNKISTVVLPESVTTLEANWIHTPNPDHITGADGKWYNADTGVGYEPYAVPSNVAATYVAVNPLTITLDVPDSTSSKTFTVTGTVAFADASVTVNDVVATVNDDKTWFAEVTLDAGTEAGRTITAAATLNNYTVSESIVYSTRTIDDTNRSEIGYTGVEGETLNIPATYTANENHYIVTSIGNRAFNGCTGLSNITIPNSVTSIGSYAFNNCSSLSSITIPNSVTSIGSSAFNKCNHLTVVALSNSITTIEERTFYACNLTSIIIPDGVTTIGDSAFAQCAKLTSITIPSSVTSFGSNSLTGYWYNAETGTRYKAPDRIPTGTAATYVTNMTTFTISYDLSGGVLAEGITNPSSYTATTETITLNNPAREGFTFLGWTGSNGNTPQTDVQIPTGSLGSKGYIANWEAIPIAYLYDDVADVPAVATTLSLTSRAEVLNNNNTGKAIVTNSMPNVTELNEKAAVDAPAVTTTLSLTSRAEVLHNNITGKAIVTNSMPNVTELNEKAAADAPSKASLSGWMIDSGFAQQLSSVENLEIVLQAIYAEAPDWEMTLTPLYENADVGELLLACATKELGTRESTSDYIWLETGEYKGYTKYGAYYGLPYGDWCAMFIGWCMDQVGLGDLPFSPGCYIWVDMAKEAGLYRNAAEYVPGPGDIAFIDYDADTYADHVVIVKSVDLENGTYTTIEGNYSNSVMEVIRPLNTHTIGYMVVSNKGVEQEVTLSQADGSSIPVNPAEPGNDMVPTKPSETTEPSVPETSETETAGTTESSVPETKEPATTEPTVPDVTVPPASGTTVSTGPDMPNSSVPETTVPSSSATTETTVPDNTVPSVPETTVPPVTDTTEPAVPDTTGTTVPDTTTPDTTVPTESNATEPPVPTTDDPASKETEPTIPSSETPSVPKETETVVSQPVTSSEPVVSTTLPNAAAVDPDEAEELEKEQDSPVETTETSKENQ